MGTIFCNCLCIKTGISQGLRVVWPHTGHIFHNEQLLRSVLRGHLRNIYCFIIFKNICKAFHVGCLVSIIEFLHHVIAKILYKTHYIKMCQFGVRLYRMLCQYLHQHQVQLYFLFDGGTLHFYHHFLTSKQSAPVYLPDGSRSKRFGVKPCKYFFYRVS